MDGETVEIQVQLPTEQEEGEGEGEVLNINLTQDLHSLVGVRIWDSSYILLTYLLNNLTQFTGKSILEVSSGCGLLLIFFCKLPCKYKIKRIVGSENYAYKKVLENLQTNLKRNKVQSQVEVCNLVWGDLSLDRENLKEVEYFFASDIFYQRNDFEDVIGTISYLLNINLKAKFLLAYCERSVKRSIQPLLETFQLKGKLLKVDQVTHIFAFGNKVQVEDTVFLFEITCK